MPAIHTWLPTWHYPSLPQFVVCPTDCHVMTLFLGNRGSPWQAEHASELVPLKQRWMHDPSIRPKRYKRAWSNTLTSPRKCHQLWVPELSALAKGLEEDDSTAAEPKSATPLIGLLLKFYLFQMLLLVSMYTFKMGIYFFQNRLILVRLKSSFASGQLRNYHDYNPTTIY